MYESQPFLSFFLSFVHANKQSSKQEDLLLPAGGGGGGGGGVVEEEVSLLCGISKLHVS
jgi:hypothetical protein